MSFRFWRFYHLKILWKKLGQAVSPKHFEVWSQILQNHKYLLLISGAL
jgi:hypothetical protein